MEVEKFIQLAHENTTFQRVVEASASKYYGTELRAGAVEVAFLMLFFPVAKFIVSEIGMPWVIQAKRLSDLQIERLRSWIEQEYKRKGLEEKLVAAGKGFFEALSEIEKADQEQFVTALLKQ
jgi:hypothetical protein